MNSEIKKRTRPAGPGRPIGRKNKSPSNKLEDYDIYGVGSNRKLEWKGGVQANSLVDAEVKAKLFSIVAGCTFSHVKLKQK